MIAQILTITENLILNEIIYYDILPVAAWTINWYEYSLLSDNNISYRQKYIESFNKLYEPTLLINWIEHPIIFKYFMNKNFEVMNEESYEYDNTIINLYHALTKTKDIKLFILKYFLGYNLEDMNIDYLYNLNPKSVKYLYVFYEILLSDYEISVNYNMSTDYNLYKKNIQNAFDLIIGKNYIKLAKKLVSGNHRIDDLTSYHDTNVLMVNFFYQIGIAVDNLFFITNDFILKSYFQINSVTRVKVLEFLIFLGFIPNELNILTTIKYRNISLAIVMIKKIPYLSHQLVEKAYVLALENNEMQIIKTLLNIKKFSNVDLLLKKFLANDYLKEVKKLLQNNKYERDFLIARSKHIKYHKLFAIFI